MIKVYNATQTLKGYNETLCYTNNKVDADLMVVGGKAINLDEFPNLKGIFKTGVGTDNLPFDEAKKRGIEIKLPSERTREIIYDETASFTLHLILNFIYNNVGNFTTWKKSNRRSLQDYQVLVMGCGKIGTKVIERLSPLCKVVTYDPLQNERNELNHLISTSDVISLHMPLLPDTMKFFNQEKLALISDGSLIVNTARGPIIDEQALYSELKNGRIHAAIDVFWEEPYHGILTELENENIKLTPHVASTCKDFLDGLANDFLSFHAKFL